MESKFLELEAWRNLVNSKDWSVFRKLLEEHKQALQKEVNICLRKHDDRRAGEALAKMDDCDKLIDLIKSKLKSLQEEK